MKTKSRNPDQNLISHLPLLPAEESPFKGIFSNVCDMQLDLVNGAEYEPDNKKKEADKREHGEDHFEEEGHETAAAAARRTTARAVALFLRHDRVAVLDQKAKREQKNKL
uniref:Uncharacterized protein n=1 Tax=Salix viminalis TaxID=40686 RepID=A0A6N2KTS2_SALVM